MKKAILLSFVLMLTGAVASKAQYALAVGDKQFNIGAGFSGYGIPIYLGLDFGVDTDISAGAQVAFRRYNERWGNYRYRHSVTSISGNANYHFNGILDIPAQYDFYAGLNVGFYIWNSSADYLGDRASGLGLGAQIGGRYYFNDKVALNLEFGGGYNAFGDGKLGLSIKF